MIIDDIYIYIKMYWIVFHEEVNMIRFHQFGSLNIMKKNCESNQLKQPTNDTVDSLKSCTEYPSTPKPCKMKVLNQQNMGYNP